MPASFIEHKGKKILFIDYHGLIKKEDMMKTLDESMELFKELDEKARTLIDITDAAGSKEWMDESKKRGKAVSDKVHKSAIVGVTGIKKVLLMGYNAVAGGRVKPFDTKEQALDYLSSD